jgi:protein MpaA
VPNRVLTSERRDLPPRGRYGPEVVRRTCLLAVAVITACSGDGDTTPGTSATEPTPTSSTSATSSTSSTSMSSSSSSTSATSSTTSTSTTTAPHVADLVTDAVQVVEFGRSVEGRPLVAVERGTSGGVVVLVVGVIHGDEAAGVAILDRLATAPVPEGVDLWLVESMNPDGQAASRRTNANLVDLNRNFPFGWAPLEEPGGSQYGGTGPASEPETQAMVGLISLLQPDLGIWYHQDLFRIAPGQGRDGELRARYAELTGLPVLDISGGTYTGVAATWQRRTVENGIAFIVELGASLTEDEATVHADAVRALARDVASGA